MVRRMSLWRINHWAMAGEMPWRANKVAKVWRRLWASTVRPWAFCLGMLAAARSRLKVRRKFRPRWNSGVLDAIWFAHGRCSDMPVVFLLSSSLA